MSERMFFFYRVIVFLWDIDISSDWLIITKSYPKVSYLWVTFSFFPHSSWIPSAQHLMCICTTADMQAHNSCCAVQGINNPEDRYYIFWQLLLYLPITSIILSCCYSYIFRLLLLYFPAATPISFDHFSYIFQ